MAHNRDHMLNLKHLSKKIIINLNLTVITIYGLRDSFIQIMSKIISPH